MTELGPRITLPLLASSAVASLRRQGAILAQLALLYGALAMLITRPFRSDLDQWVAYLTADDRSTFVLGDFLPGLILSQVLGLALSLFMLLVWARVLFTPTSGVLYGGLPGFAARWRQAAGDLLQATVLIAATILLATLVASLASSLLTGGGSPGFAFVVVLMLAFVPVVTIVAGFMICLVARAHDQRPRLVAILMVLRRFWPAISSFAVLSYMGVVLASVALATLLSPANNPLDLNGPIGTLVMYLEEVINFFFLAFLTAGFGSIWLMANGRRRLIDRDD